MSYYLLIKYLKIVYKVKLITSFIFHTLRELPSIKIQQTPDKKPITSTLLANKAPCPHFRALAQLFPPQQEPYWQGSLLLHFQDHCLLYTLYSSFQHGKEGCCALRAPHSPWALPSRVFTSLASALCSLLLAMPHLTAPSAVAIWSNRSWSHWVLTGEVWTNASYEHC